MLFEVRRPELTPSGLTLCSSRFRERTSGEGVWWRTEHRRRAHASASDVAWILDASPRRLRSDRRRVVGSSGSTRARAYLLAHYWDGEVPTELVPRTSASGIFSQAVTSSPIYTRDPRTSSTAPRRRVTPSRVAHSPGWPCALGDSETLCRRPTPGGTRSVAPRYAPRRGARTSSSAAGFALTGVEVVIPGDANALSRPRTIGLALHVRAVLVTGSGTSSLLEARRAGSAYVCRAGVCQLPATPSPRSTSSCVTWEPDVDLFSRPRRTRQQAPGRAHAPARHR
jgi:hypothetical protein